MPLFEKGTEKTSWQLNLQKSLTETGWQFAPVLMSDGSSLPQAITIPPHDLPIPLYQLAMLPNFAAFGSLEALYQNGALEERKVHYTLPFHGLYDYLSDDENEGADLLALDIPPVQEHPVHLRSKGILRSASKFRIEVEIRNPNHTVLQGNRHGPLFSPTNTAPFLLPQPTWQLLETIANTPSDELDAQVNYVATVKRLAETLPYVSLDGYLQQQNVHLITEVEPAISMSDPSHLDLNFIPKRPEHLPPEASEWSFNEKGISPAVNGNASFLM